MQIRHPRRSQGHTFGFAKGAVCALLLLGLLHFLLSAKPQSKPQQVWHPQDPAGPNDADLERRESVREAFMHAWRGYVSYGWGADELLPRSQTGKYWGKHGRGYGLTILEGMSTLWLMGEHKEFEKCVQWVRENLSFDVDHAVSHFEATIRMLGMFLTCCRTLLGGV